MPCMLTPGCILRCFGKLWRPASRYSVYQMKRRCGCCVADQRQQEAACLTSAAKFCTMRQCSHAVQLYAPCFHKKWMTIT